MTPAPKLSDNSRRIARNTLYLYFRMLLIMLVGLFTTRVVLRTLGFDDYGLYAVVCSIVALGNIVASSGAQALSRYIAAGLEQGDADRSRKVFSTGVIVMMCLAAVVVLLVETLGLWYLHHGANVPYGRMDAAEWVLQCSLGVLVLSILSVPYNATILSHEKMSGFALISILEALLKLGVAFAILATGFDKLKSYAVLMLCVAVAVRLTYGLYCRKCFPETRGRLSFHKDLFHEMMGFAGWNFLGSSAHLLNTQGVNLVVNFFFGVAMNAARGVAGQIENIVRQFVSNIVIAINPQITRQYVAGNKNYAFELVTKGVKYAGLVILFFLVPYIFEADRISLLLFGRNPEGTGIFSCLALGCIMVDLALNTIVTLELATGKIKHYYIITSSISILVLPLCWLAFRAGAPAYMAYVIFIAVYMLVDVARLLIVRAQTGYPIRKFCTEAMLPVAEVGLMSALVAAAFHFAVPDGWWRFAAVILASLVSTAVSAYFFALSKGEKTYVKSKIMAKFVK